MLIAIGAPYMLLKEGLVVSPFSPLSSFQGPSSEQREYGSDFSRMFASLGVTKEVPHQSFHAHIMFIKSMTLLITI